MTISTSTSRADYSGNGSTTTFVVPFYFLANSHIQIIKTTAAGVSTTLVLDVDYSVTGAAVLAGGSVTLVTTPATGDKISILRNVPFTQEVDYQTNDPFPAETHERALDKLTMESQQLNESVSRAITIPLSLTGVSNQLPTPSATKSLKWSADGLSLVNTTYDPDAVALSANNSAVSAGASASSAAVSAVSAANSLTTFKGIYYGSLTTDPSLDANGNALGAGDLYFNSTTSKLRIYNGSSWQDTAVATPASFTSNVYSGNASTTAFTLTSTPASVASIFVFVSGVAQRPTTDYTVSGTTLTFTSAPPTGTNNVLAFVASSVAAGTPDNASVSTAKLQDASVTTAKIVDANVTPAKLSAAFGSWVTASTAALARAALGLTSAAITTIGTAANNLVALDSAGKLPAVDGSQLTGIGASGRLLNTQYFTTVGSSTYTPTTGTNSVIVEVVGGGGGGYRGGSTQGSAGGTSSFGAIVSATGGAANNGSGGSGSGGDLNITGAAGISSGVNGGSPGGTAAKYSMSGLSNGGTNISSPAGYGAGGGGAGNGTLSGSTGSGGGYAIKKISSGFSGATVTVGAAGTGPSGAAYAGTQGLVIVYEYA